MAAIDVELVAGLALPYQAGAQTALSAPGLDPALASAWQALEAAFPGISLDALFTGLPVEQLADLADGARTNGIEPPDLFSWFTIPCDDAVVDALLVAVQGLPFVTFAQARPRAVPASLISYGTNPFVDLGHHLHRAPAGVDAVYAWHVAGGTGDGVVVVDVENAWRVDHEDLLGARIHEFSVVLEIGAAAEHGTMTLGTLVAQDNGVGTVGLVPDAGVELVSQIRSPLGNSDDQTHDAVLVAGVAAGSGGVVLLEVATPFNPGSAQADVFVESARVVQVAIAFVTALGVTVVEPAGNGGVDLDGAATLAHCRPGSPTFVDSGAIVVGRAGLVDVGLATQRWERTFCTFGSRVDCFVAAPVFVPNAPPDRYQLFSGTSGASAVIAGVVASIQGMARAQTGSFLMPSDVRRLLRDPGLGTPLVPGAKGGIGAAMPSLRRVAQNQGRPRILPVSAAPRGTDGAVAVHLDGDDRLVRRDWTFFTGWLPAAHLPDPDGSFAVNDGQPVVQSAFVAAPAPHVVTEIYAVGPGGIHCAATGLPVNLVDLSTPVSQTADVAQGSSPAAARVAPDTVVVATVDPDGRLGVLTGDPFNAPALGLGTRLVLDSVGSYRRTPGPAIATRGPSLADVVVIEDGGSLRWFSGTTIATIGTGWTPGITVPGITYDPQVRPALLAVGDRLLAAAAGGDGGLRVIPLDPLTPLVGQPQIVDEQVVCSTGGPVALALTGGGDVVVLMVDVDGVLRAATNTVGDLANPLAPWSPLAPVDPLHPVSPLGGVTAVSMPDLGVLALAVDPNGTIRSSLSKDGLVWENLQALP